MARDIRVVKTNGQTGRMARVPVVIGPEPQTTDEARHAIEQARDRISATLDAIEDRIEARKEEIKEKVDVLGPVRARIRSRGAAGLGIVFGTGLALGLLTGGDDEEPARGRPAEEWVGRGGYGGGFLDEAAREDLRRWRADRRSRLRGIARLGDTGNDGPSGPGVVREHGRGVTGRRGRSRIGTGSMVRQFGLAILSAVEEGLRERARRSRAG